MNAVSEPAKFDAGPADASAIRDIRVETDPARLEALWRHFETLAVGHVFQTYGWMKPWIDNVAAARGIEPRIVVGYLPDGRVGFLFPFGRRRSGGVRVLEWLGGEHADYHAGLFDPVVIDALSHRPGAFRTVFDRVMAALNNVDLAQFSRQPRMLGSWTNPFLALPTFPNASSAHQTRLGTDWESYYATKRGGGWRRTDRNKLKKLGEIGEVRFVIADDDATRATMLDALFPQKREGLARMGVPDMFAPPGVEAFYRALAANAWPEGPSQVSALYCGDRIAAVSFGVIFRDTYYYVLHSYDLSEDIAGHSPGRALMYELMQWAIANRITVFDFTIGDEIATRACGARRRWSFPTAPSRARWPAGRWPLPIASARPSSAASRPTRACGRPRSM